MSSRGLITPPSAANASRGAPPAGMALRLNKSDPLAACLLMAMPFNEGAGDLVHDYAGLAGVGTGASNHTWATTERGVALLFGNNANKVDHPPMFVGAPLSFSCWVNTPAGNTGVERYIYRVAPGGFSTYNFLITAGNSAGDVGIGTNAILAADTWYHLVFTVSGDGIFTVFVNGVQDNQSGVLGLWATPDNWSEFSYDFSGGSRLNSYLNNCYFWSRELRPGEAARLWYDPWCLYRQQMGVLIGTGTNVSGDALFALGLGASFAQEPTCSPALGLGAVFYPTEYPASLQADLGLTVGLDSPSLPPNDAGPSALGLGSAFAPDAGASAALGLGSSFDAAEVPVVINTQTGLGLGSRFHVQTPQLATHRYRR